ncbi:thiamine transport system substrate-binding protein [Sinorhizobium fredii]
MSNSRHRKILSRLAIATLAASAFSANAVAADKTLTIYTYESFITEWGPGAKVAEAFEKTCDCKVNYVGVADGVELLTRLKLEGEGSKADIVLGLDTNLVAEAKATGYFAPHGVDAKDVKVPGDFSDDTFLPYDYGHFAVIYDTETLKNPPKSLKELVEGDPAQKIVIEDPRTSTPGLGLLLWVKSVYGDKAGEAWAKLKERVLTVTPGWSEAYGLFTKGEAPMVLSYTTSPAYHMVAEGTDRYQAAPFGRRPLHPDRSGGPDEERQGARTRPHVPRLHDRPGIPVDHPHHQLDDAGRRHQGAAARRLRQARQSGKDLPHAVRRGCRQPQGLDRRMAGGDEQELRQACSRLAKTG